MTLLIGDEDLNPARQDNVESVGFFACPQDKGVSRIAAVLDASKQLTELQVAKRRKQRDALENLRIQR